VQYALFRGLFAVRTVPSWLEVFAWFAYLVPTMWLFFRTIRRPMKAPPPAAVENAA
jgi:high-affinity Fe2+/Pb2+ permease